MYTFSKKLNVVIYGAGSAGSLLEKSLRITNSHNIICFVDDDEKLWENLINDVEIYPPSKLKKYQSN